MGYQYKTEYGIVTVLSHEEYAQLLANHSVMSTTSDLIHFKIIPSVNKTPVYFTLIVYAPNSQIGTVSRYSTLDAAITAAGLVALPSDQTFGGIPEGGVLPGGPIVSPSNPASSDNS